MRLIILMLLVISVSGCQQDVTHVDDSGSLTISGTPVTSVNVGSSYTFTPAISNSSGESVAFSIENKPAWASFNANNGALTGNPGAGDVGSYASVTISANAGTLSASLLPFSINVNSVTPVFTISGTPSTAVVAGNGYSFTPSLTNTTGNAPTFAIANKPTWATFSTVDGSLTGTPAGGDVGTTSNIAISVTATGGYSDTLANFSITVSAAPVFTVSGTPSTAVVAGSGYSFTPSLTNTTGNTPTFAIANKPTWATFSTVDGSLTGTPAGGDVGTTSNIAISVTATGGYSDTLANFSITVSAAPVFTISGTPSTAVVAGNGYSFTPSLTNTTGNTPTFAIANKPSWATFSTVDGSLTGTPAGGDVGTTSNIAISVTATGGYSDTLANFSITVSAAANQAPVLSGQNKTGLTFSDSVSTSISYSDPDHANSALTMVVVTTPSNGTIAITNHETGSFTYSPSSADGIDGDSFTVKVNDGALDSTTETITLAFSDASAPSISLTPSNGASNVVISTSLGLTSDDPIDLSTLTYNGINGPCTGSIQISLDSFTNCLAISGHTPSSLDRSISFTLSANLTGSTAYEMKATTAINNRKSLALASDETNSFTTSVNELVITEVGVPVYTNDLKWFEVYNGTSSTVDLSDYKFFAMSYDGASISTASTQYLLPAVNVSPGQYVVIRSQDTSENYGSNSRIVHVNNGTKTPWWSNIGFIDLVNVSTGLTVDFLTWGNSYAPTTGSAWSGAQLGVMPTNGVSDYGKAYARNASHSDTNTASDWTLNDWATTGGANDYCGTVTDTDSDGIPDCNEQPGTTYAGLPLYDWGARAGQPDIFIEVDYMDADDGQVLDEGIVPRQEALQNVVDVFNAQGVKVHFDAGDLFDQAVGLDPTDFDLGGGEEVPFAAGISFDPVDARANLYDYKRDYMDYSRMQVFHYMLMANSQVVGGGSGSSGLAELNANDLIITLGDWSLNSATTSEENKLINFQASTIMHELGHNLGLQHGGDVSTNDKPNYVSVMNYVYQLSGLPTIGGAAEGDRYYFDIGCFGASYDWYDDLTNSPLTATYVMDFSDGTSSSLNYASVNETLGLGRPASSNVDYDCDGNNSETSVSIGAGTANDHDDWSNLNLVFQRSFSGYNHGLSSEPDPLQEIEATLVPDHVGDDRSPVAQEWVPTASFFEKLKQHAH